VEQVTNAVDNNSHWFC